VSVYTVSPARGILPPVPKLTVYIGDDLSSRLEPFRSRLNLSEVAKAAIEERLREEERAHLGDRRGIVLQRLLRAEGRRSAIRTSGYDDGARWAEEVASWPELQEVVGWPAIYEAAQFTRTRPAVVLGAIVVSGVVETSGFRPAPCYIPPSVNAGPPDGDDDTVTLFWVGFKEGVLSVHDLVKHEMEPSGERQVSAQSRDEAQTRIQAEIVNQASIVNRAVPMFEDDRTNFEMTLFQAGKYPHIDFDYKLNRSDPQDIDGGWELRFTPHLGAYALICDSREATLKKAASEHERLVKLVRGWKEWINVRDALPEPKDR
jgi:hypothetical protein